MRTLSRVSLLILGDDRFQGENLDRTLFCPLGISFLLKQRRFLLSRTWLAVLPLQYPSSSCPSGPSGLGGLGPPAVAEDDEQDEDPPGVSESESALKLWRLTSWLFSSSVS